MRLFFKYFLLFIPTFFASIISNEIQTIKIRTEAIPYSLFYIKINYRLVLILAGLFFPIIFFVFGLLQYGFNLLLLKYTLVTLTFMAGLWIISSHEVLIEIKKAAKIFFWIFFILAIIQNTNFLVGLSDIFSFFFSKGGLGRGQSYRGASLFYSEAARASFYVLFVYLMAYGYKINRENFWPLIAMLLLELVLIRSTSGYFLILLFFIINYPIRMIVIIFISYFIFINFQLLQIPEIQHYKVDYLLSSFIDQNVDTLNALYTLSGGRVDGLIFSVSSIFFNPLGTLFEPDLFEPLGHQLAVSAPITFLRSFGIFSIIYIYIFLSYLGKGNLRSFIYILLLASLYSPNHSSLVLLAAVIGFKTDEIYEN